MIHLLNLIVNINKKLIYLLFIIIYNFMSNQLKIGQKIKGSKYFNVHKENISKPLRLVKKSLPTVSDKHIPLHCFASVALHLDKFNVQDPWKMPQSWASIQKLTKKRTQSNNNKKQLKKLNKTSQILLNKYINRKERALSKNNILLNY